MNLPDPAQHAPMNRADDTTPSDWRPVTPRYAAPMEPWFPCRRMPTRHCPAIYDARCDDDGPCARYESESWEPWYPELEHVDNPACLCLPCQARRAKVTR